VDSAIVLAARAKSSPDRQAITFKGPDPTFGELANSLADVWHDANFRVSAKLWIRYLEMPPGRCSKLNSAPDLISPQNGLERRSVRSPQRD
jgi:hypothetical protein